MAPNVNVTAQDRYTVAGLIRHLARQQADAEMLVQGAERRTWAQEFDVACRVAQAAQRDGLGIGDRIAFLDRNGIAYFDFLFGGALLGAVNVAVNWRLAPAEMGAIIDDSGAPVLAIHVDYLAALKDMPSALPSVRRIVVIGDDAAVCTDARAVSFGAWIEGASSEDPGHVGGSDEVSMQLYTSGTTGLPKGVMLTNANLSTAISEAGTTFHIAEDTVSLVAMPLFHIGGSGWALCAMSRGGRSIILRDVDPTVLLELIATERITEMFVVPAVLMMLLVHPLAGSHRSVEPAGDLLRGVPNFRRCPGQVHVDVRVRVLPGLRHDRDHRGHHGALRSRIMIRTVHGADSCVQPARPTIRSTSGWSIPRADRTPFSARWGRCGRVRPTTWRATGGSPTRPQPPLTPRAGSRPATRDTSMRTGTSICTIESRT